MSQPITKRTKRLFGLLGLSIVIMIFGFLFLVNAMGIATFYPHYAAIENALAKYIVVILTMATGIMLFSNVALSFEDKKLRNGLTIFITAFAFILTVPLTYVFISLLPFAGHYNSAEGFATVDSAIKTAQAAYPSMADASAASADMLGLNPIDKIMGVQGIFWGFCDWFGTGAFLWVVLSVMFVLGWVFLLEPLAAGICVCKGKILNIAGKKDGKFRILYTATLPVLAKQEKSEFKLDESEAA